MKKENHSFPQNEDLRDPNPQDLALGEGTDEAFEIFRQNMDQVLAGELEVESAEQLVDPVIWQRLVDGRLTDQQYQDVLMFAELRPELWRPCALAFLQEQVFKAAISQAGPALGKMAGPAMGELDPVDSKVATTHSDAVRQEAKAENVDAQRSSQDVNKSNRRGVGVKLVLGLSSLAAGFFFTLGLPKVQSPASKHLVPVTPVVLSETGGFFKPKGCKKPIETDISSRAISVENFEKNGFMFSPTLPQTPLSLASNYAPEEWSVQRRFYVFEDQSGRIYYQPIDRFEINPAESH